MTRQAKGTFEVKRSAEPALDMGDGKEAVSYTHLTLPTN